MLWFITFLDEFRHREFTFRYSLTGTNSDHRNFCHHFIILTGMLVIEQIRVSMECSTTFTFIAFLIWKNACNYCKWDGWLKKDSKKTLKEAGTIIRQQTDYGTNSTDPAENVQSTCWSVAFFGNHSKHSKLIPAPSVSISYPILMRINCVRILGTLLLTENPIKIVRILAIINRRIFFTQCI